MAKKLNISFKDTDMDMQLYHEIVTHTDKSAFVKEAVQFYMKNNKSVMITPPTTTAKISSGNKESREILNILG